MSVASFETFGSGSFGGPLGGPVGFGGPLGVRPAPRGRRRRPAGAPEMKAPMHPQGAPMWPKATHGGRRTPPMGAEGPQLAKRACPPRRGLEGEPRSGSNFYI